MIAGNSKDKSTAIVRACNIYLSRLFHADYYHQLLASGGINRSDVIRVKYTLIAFNYRYFGVTGQLFIEDVISSHK